MKTTVEWPEGLTRERLMELADWITDAPSGATIAQALRALAAIAPSGKPETERVSLWQRAGETRWENSDFDSNWTAAGWAKVGACEVPVLPKNPRTVTMHFYRGSVTNSIRAYDEPLDENQHSAWMPLFTREIPLEA